MHAPVFDLNVAISEATATVLRAVNDPIFLLLSVLAAMTVYFHYTSFASGPVGQWVAENPGNKLAKWVSANEKRFLGAVLFLPSVYRMPQAHRAIVAVLVIMWVALIPESGVYQYAVQSFALFLYVNVKRSSTRMTLIAVVCAIYWSGWLVEPASVATAKTAT